MVMMNTVYAHSPLSAWRRQVFSHASKLIGNQLFRCVGCQQFCSNAPGSKSSTPKPPSENRFNAINIQMLTESLHQQIFNEQLTKNNRDSHLERSIGHLKHHDLWGKEGSTIPDIDLKLPHLRGNDIDEHFRNLANEQSGPYRQKADRLSKLKLPPQPKEWSFAAGWTRYDNKGDTRPVTFPDEDCLVFDIETLVPEGHYPTMATAVSEHAWYSWCSERLIADKFKWSGKPSLGDLIPLEECAGASTERLVIGHNASFDRSFVAEQYSVQTPKSRYLDTMSLHIAVSGFTSFQRVLYNAKKTNSQRQEVRDYEQKHFRGPPNMQWMKHGTLNNLNDVYQLYTKGKALEKQKRNVFVVGTMAEIRDDFQGLMSYCASDVDATHKVFQKVWPIFCERFPHPVTFAGMLEMGSAYLPVNSNWERYITSSEETYQDLQHDMKFSLMKLADDACRLIHDDKYLEDPWLWNEDWSVQKFKLNKTPTKKTEDDVKAEEQAQQEWKDMFEEGEIPEPSPAVKKVLETGDRLPKRVPDLVGYPAWYRTLCPKPSAEDWSPGPSLISTQTRIAGKLLRLTWDGFPIHWDDIHGWGYLVPGRDDNLLTEEELQEAREDGEPQFPYQNALNICRHLLPGDPAKQSRDEQEEKVLLEKAEQLGLNWEESQRLWMKIKNSESNLKKRFRGQKGEGPSFHRGDGPYTEVDIPGCWFFKIPHKDGAGKRVGNLLAKDYLSKLEDGTLKAYGGQQANQTLQLSKMCSYWKNARERISKQMVLRLQRPDLPQTVTSGEGYDENSFYGAIIPRVVTAGTVTRRAVEPTWLTASNAYEDRVGSELKAMIQAPPGYHFVGADVDSQELWIAAILGDSHFGGMHGCTAFGWMTLQGKKSAGTDLHSKTADMVGISRDNAKIFNYGRIYGAGRLFAEKLLLQFNHRLTQKEANKKARVMYEATKGVRKLVQTGEQSKKIWVGGTESHMFNKLEDIALSDEPVTPVLGCRISQALESKTVGDDFMTSRVNWVVQSSAVDYLHLMLVSMRWLFEEYGIDGRFCISIHDEVRYLVTSGDRYRAALALQITNLLTRCMFAYKLGMKDLPQSVAFFSSVDIDKCLRKEVTLSCKSPSNPHGMERAYGIPTGEALDIYEVMGKTNSSLCKDDQPEVQKQKDEYRDIGQTL